MMYSIKEIFYTLQGEGANSGLSAVFCRFSGCNLWSGRVEDRTKAICQFCDTDFVGTDGTGGGKFACAQDLAKAIEACWPSTSKEHRFVVLTGGEPLLQIDEPLIDVLKERGFTIAVETNGTCAPPSGIDWVCVSPKAGAPIVVEQGQELKLVFPQAGIDPAQFEHLRFSYFYLQPMDGNRQSENIQLAISYCMANPQWRLSVQTHKMIGIR